MNLPDSKAMHPSQGSEDSAADGLAARKSVGRNTA